MELNQIHGGLLMAPNADSAAALWFRRAVFYMQERFDDTAWAMRDVTGNKPQHRFELT